MLKCFNTSFSSSETFVTFPGTSNTVADGYEIAIPIIEFCSSSSGQIEIKKYNAGSSSYDFYTRISIVAKTPYVLNYKQFFTAGQKLSFKATSSITVYVSVSYDNSLILN